MQGPNYLDLAKNIADSHLDNSRHRNPANSVAAVNGSHKARAWIGRRLINIGERIVPHPRDLQLKVSTGPPCP